jgi:transposase InsO family protein
MGGLSVDAAGAAALAREWFTARELAGFKLPGLPTTKRRVYELARRDQWMHRDRAGRGGGVEYHISALPMTAHVALSLQFTPRSPSVDEPAEMDRTELWGWFESLPETKKTKARDRLEAVDTVMTLYRTGMAKDLAVIAVAHDRKARGKKGRISAVYEWLKLIERLEPCDWLPALAPRQAGRQKTSECDPDAWDMLRSDYLRSEAPNFSDCYRRVETTAKVRGWKLPSERTMLRRIESAIPKAVIVLAREGADAVKRMFPAQERDRSVFHALEAVNADGHRWDIWVKWPDGTVARPCMVAFQDLYSGKILSWRVDQTMNSGAVRLALGDLVETWGIIKACWLDNGREFANKWLTGGTPTRYRFKVREEDPSGILTQLGVDVHWTQPYSGQSKPIERAFRDFAQNIAKHPAFAGAYTGNSPVDKPENYRSRAIDLEDFITIARAEIMEHNARPGRLSKVCGGTLSFDAAFAVSYQQAPIIKATEEQRRLWLLAAEGVSVSSRDGSLKLMGNRYWADFLHLHLGETVAARFDPDFLHDGLHVYRMDGAYLGLAPVIEPAGFADADAAREHGRQRKRWLRAQREMLDAERRMSPAAVAALLPTPTAPSAIEPTVIQLARPVHDLRRRPSREVSAELEARREAEIAEFRRPAAKADPINEADARFERAMAIELAIATGGEFGDGEVEWLERYRQMPEYRARLRQKKELEEIEQAEA